ncbi:MAG TPA: sigma-70 family RNA polymerase sigma factor [Candidatus Binatia bacterium]
MSHAPLEQHNREVFFAAASHQLNRLYDFVRHQLAYFESIGDLVPGELTAEDVVDDVMLGAYHEFLKQPDDRDIGKWLTELARERLRRKVKRLKSDRKRAVHIEEDVLETAPAEAVTSLGEEILDFYQPDDDLKLEDMFPDVDVSTPEVFVAAKEELLRCVNAALAGMPREWRRTLRQRYVSGLTAAELAAALDKSAPEIERILEYGRQHLRQRLIESGCSFIAAGQKARSDASLEGRKENG